MEALKKSSMPGPDGRHSLDEQIHTLKSHRILTEDDWQEFQQLYERVNHAKSTHLRSLNPRLSDAELRYLMLYSLGITNKEIANVLGISPDSPRVTWNRIKKKYAASNIHSPDDLFAIASH